MKSIKNNNINKERKGFVNNNDIDNYIKEYFITNSEYKRELIFGLRNENLSLIIKDNINNIFNDKNEDILIEITLLSGLIKRLKNKRNKDEIIENYIRIINIIIELLNDHIDNYIKYLRNEIDKNYKIIKEILNKKHNIISTSRENKKKNNANNYFKDINLKKYTSIIQNNIVNIYLYIQDIKNNNELFSSKLFFDDFFIFLNKFNIFIQKYIDTISELINNNILNINRSISNITQEIKSYYLSSVPKKLKNEKNFFTSKRTNLYKKSEQIEELKIFKSNIYEIINIVEFFIIIIEKEIKIINESPKVSKVVQKTGNNNIEWSKYLQTKSQESPSKKTQENIVHNLKINESPKVSKVVQKTGNNNIEWSKYLQTKSQ